MPEVRGDWIHWIEPESPQGEHPFFSWMTQFREALNAQFSMGLRSQEFHFARYAEGKGYQKHIDQHRGTDHRKVSIVLYLTPNGTRRMAVSFACTSPTSPMWKCSASCRWAPDWRFSSAA
ncbi:hypothetical protein CDEF62S_03206 [Castellaniella defragrans]